MKSFLLILCLNCNRVLCTQSADSYPIAADFCDPDCAEEWYANLFEGMV